MRSSHTIWINWAAATVLAGATAALAQGTDQPEPQYQSGTILIPAASANEPKRPEFSTELADRYLTRGALAWSREHQCVSCHTNGSYLAVRSALMEKLGPPPAEIRTFFVNQVQSLKRSDNILTGAHGTAAAYIALGLAEWDAHITKSCSKETDEALRVMLSAQLDDGSWPNETCWPPLESSCYHAATVAALAVATAPGWMSNLAEGDEARVSIDRLKKFFQETQPPHDYARLLLLWVGTRMPDLVDQQQKARLIDCVWNHQRQDGGWSLRTFAAPEAWGSGNRAERLRNEPDIENPPSDGHMTGLAVLVLRDAGVAASDARIQAAVNWLKTNQRVSGRWWTRSLNTDADHYITFSASGYSLLALAKCDEF